MCYCFRLSWTVISGAISSKHYIHPQLYSIYILVVVLVYPNDYLPGGGSLPSGSNLAPPEEIDRPSSTCTTISVLTVTHPSSK